MKTALEILSEEHQNILKVIDVLLEECNSIESGKDIDKNFFSKTIDFVRGYADKFHHAKEENILFIEMRKDEVNLPCNPIDQMLYEHDLGRGFIKELEVAVEEGNKEKVVESARGYGKLLQGHIFKEDNILYQMADEALSSDVKDSMLDRFKKVEEELIQEKNKYLLFLKELGK